MNLTVHQVTRRHLQLYPLPLKSNMPPKAAGKEKIVDSEEVLQAVVIAETFNERFKPLTTNKPRVS